MAQSTSLIGPYDRVPTTDKTRAQVGIPNDIYDEILVRLLIYRGSQDKILWRLFYVFHSIPQHYHPQIFDEKIATREEIVNDILNHIQQAFDSYVPTIPTTDQP